MDSIDKDIHEKDGLINWSQENALHLKKWADANSSCFSQFNNDENVRSFGWSNMLELKQQLESKWQNEEDKKEIALICAVAAYKRRSIYFDRDSEELRREYNDARDEEKDKESLPDYIYIF